MMARGWPSDLSSASDGPGILLHSVGYLRLGHGEALQDRVPAWPRLRRMRDGLGEVGVRHAQVGWRPRQAVPGQAGRDQLSLLQIPAQVSAEQGTDACQLAMAAGAWVQLVDGVHDLVVTAAGGPARPG